MSWAGHLRQAFVKGMEDLLQHDIKKIKEEEADMQVPSSVRNTTCEVSAHDACPLTRLHERKPSVVYPGGGTSCLEDGSKYGFWVLPGDKDKVYLHFQGGGACWDHLTSTTYMACKDWVGGLYNTGIFNKSDDRNPIKSHTIVFVTYCSGDMMGGDKRKPYAHLVYRGYRNTKAVVDWVGANFDQGLKSLVIGGCSAGSIGAQFWASAVLDQLRYEQAAAVFDSYLPIASPGVDAHLEKYWGMCGTPLIVDAHWRRKCKAHKLTFAEILQRAVEKHPHVTFAVLNTKGDQTQQYFAGAIGMTLGIQPIFSDGASFFRHANEYLRVLNKYPNFVSFMIGGDMYSRHCFLGMPDVYTVTVNGTFLSANASEAEPSPENHLTIAEWIGNLINNSHNVSSDCLGKRLSKADWNGTSYCDDHHQLPKVITDRAAWARAGAWGQKFAKQQPVTAHAAAVAQSPLPLGSLGAVASLLFILAAMALLTVLRRRRPRVAGLKGWTLASSTQDPEALSPGTAAE